MGSISEVLARYRELCEHCDAVALRVQARFKTGWQCRAGCSGCCQLSTVCGMEAVVLLQAGLMALHFDQAVAADGYCGLLREGCCQFYLNRPLICRTHGLPLVSVSLTEGEVDCCPMNHQALLGVSELEANLVLDLDRLTENLMRLNLAFFLALGRPELAEARFSLAALANRKSLPPELLAAAGLSSGE